MSLPLDTLWKDCSMMSMINSAGYTWGPKNWGEDETGRQAGRDYQKDWPLCWLFLVCPVPPESPPFHSTPISALLASLGGWAARAAPCFLWGLVQRRHQQEIGGWEKREVRVFIPPWQDQSRQLQIFSGYGYPIPPWLFSPGGLLAFWYCESWDASPSLLAFFVCLFPSLSLFILLWPGY